MRDPERQVQTSILGEAVDAAPAAFFVLDANGRLVTANRFACAMLGYGREEFLGLSLSDIALTADVAELLVPAEAGATQTGIAPLRHRDGSVVLVRYETRSAEAGNLGLTVCVAYPRRVLTAHATPQESAARQNRSRDNRDLSEREREILQLIAEGFENDDISKQLFISRETVKSHVRRLLHKLGARSRTHAVALALRRDLID